MKILVFSTAYFPLVGGAEIAFKETTDRIRDCDFDLITSRFSKKNAKKEKIGNIAVYRVGMGCKLDKYLLPILGYFKAKKLSKKQKYSLIWAISASQAGLAALFFKLKNSKIPFLLTVQEGSSPKQMFKRRWMAWPLIKKIFKKADYIQAISRFLANFSREMGAKCPIEVVPNGVDIQKFKMQNAKVKMISQNLKSKLHIKPNEKVIITVSRLVEKNGVGDLIKAISMLNRRNTQINSRQIGDTQTHADNQRKSACLAGRRAYFEAQNQRVSANINFKLLIIGTGHLEKKYKLQITDYGLQNKVLLLGLIPPNEVPKYLAISDVFVRPSISEGFGNVFVEAMAAGVPIIGTPVGGIPDFLVDYKTGLFCQPRNSVSIAEAIKKVLRNENLRTRLINNGKKLVEEKYSWEIIAGKMRSILETLINAKEKR